MFRYWTTGSTGLWSLGEGEFQSRPHNSPGFRLESLSRLPCKWSAAQADLGGLADLRREIRRQGCCGDLGLQDRVLEKRELCREGAP